MTCCPKVRLLPANPLFACAIYLFSHAAGFAGLCCKRAMERGGNSFWVQFVFLLLPHKVGGSCDFCIFTRSHSCPEASLPVISPLKFLPCYRSKAQLTTCEQTAPLSINKMCDTRLLPLPPSQLPAFRTELRDQSVQELVPCAHTAFPEISPIWGESRVPLHLGWGLI